MFSAIVNSRTSPRRCRSSGMCPRPASSIRRALGRSTSRPAIRTRPLSRLRRPVSASISSLCPLPSTPAMPTISPARTESETPLTAGSPRSSSTWRSSTSSNTSPSGLAGVFSTCRRTSRPTIIRASPASVAPSRGTVSIVLPRRRTVIRSAISSTSFSLCEMKITDRPSRTSARRISKSSPASCGVRTAVGSSRINTSARAVERLQDLDPLLLADADVLHLRLGVDGELVRA